MNRFIVWLGVVALGIAGIVLAVNGVPNGHPLAGLVTFMRVIAVIALVLVVALGVMASLIPGVRSWLRARFLKESGRGLSKEDRAKLSPGETQALSKMRRIKTWSQVAGVIGGGTDRKGNEYITTPGLIGCELNARGPAILVRVVAGSVPSDFDSERISAALGLPVECEPTGPVQVRVQLLSRDPFKGTRTAQATAHAPAASEAPIVLTDWTDLDVSEGEQ